MSTSPEQLPFGPFETLADYERRSLSHVAGMPEQIEAPGLWRGIAFRIGDHHHSAEGALPDHLTTR